MVTESTNTTNVGRVALVTGASRGIGQAIATTLAAQGMRVANVDVSPGGIPGVLDVQASITDQEQLNAAFVTVEKQLGPVEVLVCNAGITRDTLLMTMKDDAWASVLDVNLTGAFRVVRRAARNMVKHRYGRIVLISSVVGLLGSAGQTNYAATKAGLVGFGRSVARELGGRGITCNMVAPGFINTHMTEVLDEATQKAYLARIPAARFGEIDDVANAVAFLCSDAASYLNGVVLPVDGGLGMGH